MVMRKHCSEDKAVGSEGARAKNPSKLARRQWAEEAPLRDTTSGLERESLHVGTKGSLGATAAAI